MHHSQSSGGLTPQQLSAVLHDVFDAVIVTDPDGNLLYTNAAAQSLGAFAGLKTGDDVAQQNVLDYARETFEVTHVDGSSVAEEERPFVRATRGEPYENVTLRVRNTKHGEERIYDFSGTVIPGDPPLSVLTIRDMTEQHKAQLRYRISFETNPAPTLIARLDNSEIVDANEGFFQMTGLSAQESIGLPLSKVGLLPEAEDLRDAIHELKEGHRVDHRATTIEARGMGRRSAVVSARPIEVDDQECAIFTFLDVTELRNSEALARKRAGELQKANDELRSFNYSVSHDLRAPLRGLSGFSQILLEDHSDDLGDEARHLLQRIDEGAKKMGELLDAMLRLSEISQRELQREHVDLSLIAHSILTALRDQEPTRNVEVVIQPGVTAVGDPHLLRTLLNHLFDNAWKFTSDREPARIEFGVQPEPDGNGRDVLFVRDNGVGFDMLYADKLFLPFGRLHPVDSYPGLGVGLRLVQRILHLHGGRVWAQGEPGEGATFFFTIGSP